MHVGYECCFCRLAIDPTPPDIGQLAFSMRYQEGESGQKDLFYCHFECFVGRLHPSMKDVFLNSLEERIK